MLILYVSLRMEVSESGHEAPEGKKSPKKAEVQQLVIKMNYTVKCEHFMGFSIVAVRCIMSIIKIVETTIERKKSQAVRF